VDFATVVIYFFDTTHTCYSDTSRNSYPLQNGNNRKKFPYGSNDSKTVSGVV